MGILGTVTVPRCEIRMIVILSTQNTKENITIDILGTVTDPNQKIRMIQRTLKLKEYFNLNSKLAF